MPFRDEDEALALANAADHGLTAYLWTSGLGRALRLTERLEAGMMWVNSDNVRHLPTPFGGVKASGIGRDGGWSCDFYMETVNVAPVLSPPFNLVRLSHVEFGVRDLAASRAFYCDTIGLQVTDEVEGALWLRATEERGHHCILLRQRPADVSTLSYKAWDEEDLGRHGISDAFFLCVRDRDGHRIEICCSDCQTVDPDLEPIRWSLTDPQRQTVWGAPAPRSWFEEGSIFAGVTPRPADLAATPIVVP